MAQVQRSPLSEEVPADEALNHKPNYCPPPCSSSLPLAEGQISLRLLSARGRFCRLRAQPERCCLKCGDGAAAEGTSSPCWLEITLMAGSLDQRRSKGVSRNRPPCERCRGAHSSSFSNHTSIPPSASQPSPPAPGARAFGLAHPSCKGLSTLCTAQRLAKPTLTQKAATA